MLRIIVDFGVLEIGGLSIPLRIYGYGLMLVLGFLTAILLAQWRARRSGEDPEAITTSHCYELTDTYYNTSAGYAYFKIVAKNEMELVHSPSGTCPDTFPSGGGKKYYR